MSKVAGSADLQHVDAARLAVRAGFDQPHTDAMQDVPAGSGPAGHIVAVFIPQFLDSPSADVGKGSHWRRGRSEPRLPAQFALAHAIRIFVFDQPKV